MTTSNANELMEILRLSLNGNNRRIKQYRTLTLSFGAGYLLAVIFISVASNIYWLHFILLTLATFLGAAAVFSISRMLLIIKNRDWLIEVLAHAGMKEKESVSE